MDEFEQHLRRRLMKPVPAEWRAEILSAAATQENRQSETSREFTFADTHRSWLSTINHQLSTLLWPHPAAWAGLAAVWIFIFAVNFSIRDRTPVMAEKSVPPSPEMVAELRQQQRLYAELMGTAPSSDANRPKDTPRPRTQCAEIWTA